MFRYSAVSVALLLSAGLALAQSSPLGPEFRVNTATTGAQEAPSVSVNPSIGSFLVVWRNAPNLACLAQRYDASGIPLGGSFIGFGDCAAGPGVGAALATGEFVVFAPRNMGGRGYVYANAFHSNGTHKGYLEFANTYTSSAKSQVRVAADATGNFVVVWSAAGEDGNGYGVFARRYASTDVTIGGEFRVNTYLGLPNYDPDVASDASGNFVVVWRDLPYGFSSEVLARRFASDGSPLGDPFLVNASTTIGASHPRVTRRNGDFVVVWQEQADGSGLAVLGRRYASDGSALAGIFRVNTHTTGAQTLPAVSSKPAGGFVVAWESDGQDGSDKGIYAQKYCLGGDADGNGVVDVADVFYLINYLFAGGPAPHGCANVNGDAALDVADVFYLINYLFAGGSPPV